MSQDNPISAFVNLVLAIALFLGGPVVLSVALMAGLKFVGDVILPDSWKTAPVRTPAQRAQDSEDAYWDMIRESNTPRFER